MDNIEITKTIENESRGFIHVYTGNGKGKTTAALGLALRAAGRKKRVYIAQFLKKMPYGELESIHLHLKEFITIEQFGLPQFHHTGSQVTSEERNAAMQGVHAVQNAMDSNAYDIIILDEINVLAYFNIVELQILLDLIDKKPYPIELILTGRNAPPEFIERAQLVTEMKEIKHYYTQGIQARDGIER